MTLENESVENESTEKTMNQDERVEAAAGETGKQADIVDVASVEGTTTETANGEPDSEAPTNTGNYPEQTKRSSKSLAKEVDQVISWFAVCGRCSFFIAGYKVAVGEEELETAVAQRGRYWLTLPWTHAVANLVYKSYGNRFDIDCFHCEGCCPECHRNFVYRMAKNDDEAPTFRIELKPRPRR